MSSQIIAMLAVAIAIPVIGYYLRDSASKKFDNLDGRTILEGEFSFGPSRLMLSVALGDIIAAGGIIGIFFIVTPVSHYGSAIIFLSVSCVPFFLLGIYLLLITLPSRATLADGRLAIRTLSKEIVLPMDSILSVHLESNQLASKMIIVVKESDPIKVYLLFQDGPLLYMILDRRCELRRLKLNQLEK